MTANDKSAQDLDDDGKPHPLGDRDYFELWRYCEEVGGRDKDRMVTIATWLLAFALAILAYLFVQLEKNCWVPNSLLELFFPTIAGLVICGLAGLLIYAYGAYANRYWFMADWIKLNKIDGLSEFHDTDVFINAMENEKAPNRIDKKIIKRFYRDKHSIYDFPTTQGLVGIFKIMLGATVGLFLLFVILVIYGLTLAIHYWLTFY